MSAPAEIPPGASETATTTEAPRPGRLRSMVAGARSGVRRMSYVAGPLTLIGLIPGFFVSGIGLGAGRGWPFIPSRVLPPLLYWPIVLYLAFVACGAIVGVPLGLVICLIRRGRPGTLRARFWAAANRPIRLSGPPSRIEATETLPRRRRVWRWLLGVPTALTVLAGAVGIGLGIYLGAIVDRRLADAIAEADRDDPHWRFDDLMGRREPVPDEENSALVVAEALDLVPQNWPDSPWPAPGTPKGPPGPELAAYDRIGETPDNVRLDDMSVGILRGQLDEYAESVQLLRTVVDYRRGRHELIPGPTLFDTPLPETQASRTAARLLAADAAILAQDRDVDGALDSCRAIVGVGRSGGDEPFLISQLVRFAIGYVATDTARRVLGQGEPSDQALGRLQDLLLDERAQPLLHAGMRGERAMLDELIRRVGAGEIAISALGSEEPSEEIAGRRSVIFSWGRLMFDHQRALALEWMNEAVAISRLPAVARGRRWDAWDAEIVLESKKRFRPYVSVLPLTMTPATRFADKAQTRYQADLGATALLIAAERHRLKTGEWPASLAAIDRTILPETPVDPFTPQPYRFEREDGQITIYSVGPNLRDDRGLFDRKRSETGGADDPAASAWDVSQRGLPADDRPVP